MSTASTSTICPTGPTDPLARSGTTSTSAEVPTAVDAGSGGQAGTDDTTTVAAVLGGTGTALLAAWWVLVRRRTGAYL